MKQKIKIKNSYDCATIDIEGTIGVPEEWQFDNPQQRVATYEAFRKTLKQIEELQTPRVVVNIRSTGGDVGDALLIYEALSSLDAEITTRCWGYVASAATVIAQAASEGLREISPNTLYLVHSSTCSAEGNAQELQQRVELLKKSDERLAELYARRSGRDVESFVALMSEEGGEGRWLDSQETIEAGLADREIEGVMASEGASETAETSESSETDTPLTQRVAEGVESALRSVKGLMQRIGVQLKEDIGLMNLSQSEEEEANPSSQTEPQPESQKVSEESQKDPEKTQKDSETPQEKPQPETQPKTQTLTTKQKKSQIEFEEAQKELTETTTEPIEDPSLRDAVLSPNERAYRDDARRLGR